jgi:hypothetical protein
MEIILNLAWALSSAGLVWFWLRNSGTNPAPRRAQFMALMMVVLLLLPVISLSDDLVAAQGPAETDCCVRRALDSHDTHPSVVPAALALPEPFVTALPASGLSQQAEQDYGLTLPTSYHSRSLDSRPPPSV